MANVARTNSTRNAQVINSNDVDFIKGAPNLDVQSFLDEMVFPDGGRFVDFKYDSGTSTRGKRKASFLTVSMPKYVPTEDGIEAVVDENGEVTKPVPTTIYASKECNDVLIKQRGSDQPFKGISISAYYETDQATNKRTGKVGFMLTKSSGESVDAATLGLRI